MKKSSALSTVVASAHPLQTVNDWSLMPPTEGDAEPRVRDVDLGDRLGYAEPRMVRKLIKRLRDSGEIPGVQSRDTVERQRTRNGGEREYAVEEFWLTEREALLVCSASDAPNAGVVRAALVDLFIAWRRGQLEPASSVLSLDRRAGEVFLRTLQGIESSVAIILGNQAKHGEAIDVLGDRVKQLEDTQEHQLTHKRKRPAPSVIQEHVQTALATGGLCLFCDAPLFAHDGKWIGQIHHHDKASDARVEATMPCCGSCNRRFNQTPTPRFIVDAYHERRRRIAGPLFRVRAVA